MRTTYPPIVLWVLGATVFTTTILALGCNRNQGASGQAAFKTIEDVQPYVEPYPRAYVLTNMPEETRVRTERTPGAVKFYFERNDTSLDEEFYGYDDAEFRYEGTKNEDLQPGIPILKFPMTVGDKWDWAGTYAIPSKSSDAKASIQTSSEELKTVIGEFTAIKSVVVLEMDSGGDTPATWTLTFWTVPKRGIIKREFEYGMTREPMPQDDRNGK